MTRRSRRRRGFAASVVVAALVAVGVVALLAAFRGGEQPPQPTASQAGTLPTVIDPGAGAAAAGGAHAARVAQGPVMSASPPVSLDIASIAVHTDLLRLGLNADGTLQVPWKPLMAGWFSHSPTPGEVGPSVITGHVDSWETGPAVFYRLGEVTPGSAIVVTRANGSRAIFVVDGVREYAKADFPTSTVYGNTGRAELRLITCGGWDSSTREYDGNIVVFAHLVSSTSS